MKINGRELIFTEQFENALKDTREYLEQFGINPAKNFLLELRQLITDRIPNYPESFPVYQKNKKFRRALFKKKYYVVYQVEMDKITFAHLYHSSRNPNNIFID